MFLPTRSSTAMPAVPTIPYRRHRHRCPKVRTVKNIPYPLTSRTLASLVSERPSQVQETHWHLHSGTGSVQAHSVMQKSMLKNAAHLRA
jgi:hypothetical protein